MLTASSDQMQYTIRPKSSIQLGGGAKAYPSQFRSKVVKQTSLEFNQESTDLKQFAKTHYRNKETHNCSIQVKPSL
jgi:hypothetical protein